MTIIVLQLKRKNGSEIELYGKTYHFKPASGDGLDPKIPHTCDIPDTDAAAIHRLLSIKGYALQDPNAELPARPKADPGQTIGNEKIDAKKLAPVIITSAEGESINLTELAPEDLRILARDTFGIKPHHKWSDQTVIMKIVEATRGEN